MIYGIDTNILVYILDPLCPENERCKFILDSLSEDFLIALNPTVMHEVYTVLVYARKWERDEARRRLTGLLKDPYVMFHNQTKSASILGLHLANKYKIRGRDALILSNLITNRVNVIYTHDEEVKKLKEITWRDRKLTIKDPIKT